MAGLHPALIMVCLILYTFGTPIEVSNEESDVSNPSSYCPGMHAWCPSDKKCCRHRESHCGYLCCPFHDGVCCGEYSHHCCKRDETCTEYGCQYDGAGHNPGNPLSHPFIQKIMNVVPNPKYNDKKDSIHNIAAPQQKKLDLIKKLSEDYPIADGALCTGNKACPIKSKDGKILGYTCCPYLSEKATCCESWCCDEGFKCGPPELQTCLPQEIASSVITDALPHEGTSLYECPPELNDTCTEDQTCCITPDKHFSCAPFANATCCRDGVHSCPQGYKCDNDTNVCSPEQHTVQDVQSKPAKKDCDSRMQCSDNQTCCILTDGTYGCCPFQNAICCSDHVHCCPSDFICDHKTHSCKSPTNDSNIVALQRVSKESLADVQCKDGSVCPNGMTCCSTGESTFGCCPFEEANCCSDMAHCCPKGTVCNSERGTCDSSEIGLAASKIEKLQVTKVKPDLSNIICNEEMECRDNQTCCRLTDGTFGCCPFQNAVCCADHVHCCPNGMWCDHKTNKCKDPKMSIPMAKKLQAFQRNPADQPSVVPLAVKFPAKKPRSFQDTVLKPNSIPIGKKFPSTKKGAGVQKSMPPGRTTPTTKIPEHANKASKVALTKATQVHSKWTPKQEVQLPTDNTGLVECKDGVTYCPKATDCCKLINGQYGCCPAKTTCCDTGEGCHGCCPDPYNICCNNGEWCCGNGTVCDPKNKSCRPKGSIVCADGSFCDQGNSCCQLQDKSYTCCPEKTKCCSGGKGCCPDGWGVCCNGGEWCCQNGNKCDIPNEGCKYASPAEQIIGLVAPVFRRKDAGSKVNDVECGDGSTCPTGTTCCKLSSGGYGCCPYPKAVCCDDGEHCCPNGYTCDVSAGTCDRVDTQSELTKLSVGNVECDDGSSCPTGTTCCKLSSGGYGCCPYPEAVCCDDGEHCCPHGYTCDVSAGTCDRVDTQSELTKLSVRSVECDDGSTCPTGTTCCKLSTGGYGCCPYPEAVCCDDGEHCCPNGFTCDVSAGTCVRGTTVAEVASSDVIDCGDGTSCPDGSTCCAMSAGQFGCCSYQDAVCCDDGEHCCPNGFACDMSSGKCVHHHLPAGGKTSDLHLSDLKMREIRPATPTSTSQEMGEIRPATPTSRSQEMSEIRPAGGFCKDGKWCEHKCCYNSTGQTVGCCKFRNGICCANGTNCCKAKDICTEEGDCISSDKASSSLAEAASEGCGSCSREDTCCDGQCCPHSDAVCCSDGISCCPHQFQCDLSRGRCIQRSTGRFQPINKLKKHRVPRCDNLKPCGNGSFCPKDLECLNLFKLCYSTEREVHRNMIDDCE